LTPLRTVALGDICLFKYGQMPHARDRTDRGYPIFSGYRVVGAATRYHYRDPEIVVVARGVGGTGDIKWSPPYCFLTNLAIAVLIASPEVDKTFLYYRLASTKLWDLRTGSAQAQITIHRLRQYRVDLPPLTAQRKIAAIVSAYDDLIENNSRRIKALDEMAQRIFREWFVEFRYPGHESVTLVASELGPLPETWRVASLSTLATVTMGQSPPSSAYNPDGVGLPFHQGVGTYGEHFPVHTVYSTVGTRLADDGDILMSVRAPVGRINIADRRMILGRGLAGVRANDVPGEFLLHALKHFFREEDVIGNGVIFKAVTRRDVEGLRLVSPDAEVVREFADLAQPMLRQLRTLTAQLAELRATRDLLLPRLVSGEIDVTNLKIDVPDLAA
jgi:type I restriction enzyme, S subunit